MVSAESTARKYSGQMAANYDSKRSKQLRWDLENKAVTEMLRDEKHKTVLDIPVGTGRFLTLYKQLGLTCYGYDTSKAMLSLAKRKRGGAAKVLEEGDIRKIPHKDNSMDVSVCVRFMDLVPEDTMQQAIKELARVTRHHIILTTRLGDEYIPKVNTATHDRRKFHALLKKLGWTIIADKEIFQQGWHVLKLGRIEHGRNKTGVLEHSKP